MSYETLHTEYEFVLTDLQNYCPSNKNLKLCAWLYGFNLFLIETIVKTIFSSFLSN
jgi:hypothetical protein